MLISAGMGSDRWKKLRFHDSGARDICEAGYILAFCGVYLVVDAEIQIALFALV
jgi:hypothetical protein